ncbi:MAG: multicopper oxidase domain-containing protein, partial [Chloroflexi bacterium]|nr:multicopper oxidase domain-containing protein [Chloroflexota bacterium]
HKGLYGAFIVDPKEPLWQPAREMVMIMNAFDTDFDGENEFYAVNTLANYHIAYPIEIKRGELVRIYLINLTEFDPINSFHLHGNVFKLYRTGTRPDQYEITDLVTLCQAERCVVEFKYDMPGMFMFHAHQSEFAELGWNGLFKVVEPTAFAPAPAGSAYVCPLPADGLASSGTSSQT